MIVNIFINNTENIINFECSELIFTSLESLDNKIGEKDFDIFINRMKSKIESDNLNFSTDEFNRVLISDNSQSIFAFLPKDNPLIFNNIINKEPLKQIELSAHYNNDRINEDSLLFYDNATNSVDLFLGINNYFEINNNNR